MKAAAAQEGLAGNILLVEDDLAAARFTIYVLGERGGFEVAHETDPIIALHRAECEPWDLVITDLDLPHMSGADLMAAIRKVAPGLPVLLTTAAVLPMSEVRTLLQQADAFLQKPIRASRLLAVVYVLIAASGAKYPRRVQPIPGSTP